MGDEKPRLRTVGTWDWPRLARAESAPIVRQLDEDGCGVACVAMLLLDRGIQITLEAVGAGLARPSEAEDLASRLEELSPFKWSGGALSGGTEICWELLDFITRSRGTWAALLEPFGLAQMGHWVVVDGVSSEGLVLVRDPEGAAYGIPLGDFAELWGYTVLVVQEATS
jgi:ABC-type bacteriocin/lantibiotic exporter with double-glycine peptidase domain